ncbi:MAG: saccharopine dehydrogenase NADP-binding domain-containing protein [Candidatus Bipolaricaulota bacterium]|nr:saccharopine dehydrogenase NADP-binding domain-containing protein [Candidatus Bipolaricaulota bacterium]
MKVVVLGAGRVGSAIAIDLAKDAEFEVRVADRDPRSLERLRAQHGIAGERVDFSLEGATARAVAKADLVVSAVPGFLGYRTLQAVLEARKRVVDIAFFPEDPFGLDSLAKANGVTALVDCGVAPGMSNLLVGRESARLDRTTRVRIYVAGLPTVRVLPYEYKAGFSPIDVIEEYTRPSRVVEDGALRVKAALSDLEHVDVEGIGTLEAFVTDGLRTLLATIPCPDMAEKTMRYPGHAERIRLLRDSGFFGADPIDIHGASVRPVDVAAALLFPLWQMHDGDEDVTVMRIVVDGEKGGRPVRVAYALADRFDRTTGTSSMARTTGYTAAMAVRMLAKGLFREAGIIPPEFVGRNEDCVQFLLTGLAERGITYPRTAEPIESPRQSGKS